ncbi:MAG: FtsH protease activity modulator HflK [Pseudomonadota bacterium]
MAWNDSGNGRGRPGPGGGDQGPNDLDKIAREWQRKLSNALNGRGGSGGGKSGKASASGGGTVIFIIALIAWAATGFYRVDQAERGLVLRFGDHVATQNPGLRWHMPFPIETVEIVDIAQVSTYDKSSQMLTADEAFVVVNMAVQYRRTDPVAYKFNIRQPDETLSDVSESAIREVVGKAKLDDILLANQIVIAQNIEILIQETLDSYDAGIEVVSVNLQEIEFPREVRDAVQDAVKAREDQRTVILEAQTYANAIIPKARGQAQRQLQDAEAYRERVIADAEGNAARFTSLVAEYKKAPRVTRDRLYIEAVEGVFQRSNKVLLDGGDSALTVLPLEQMLRDQTLGAVSGLISSQPGNTGTSRNTEDSNASSSEDPRARRTR